jgi:polyribonucleotide nucleotidyltransferase
MICPPLIKPLLRGMGTFRFLFPRDCFSSSFIVRTTPTALPPSLKERKRRNLSSSSVEDPLFLQSYRYPTVTSTVKSSGAPPEKATTNNNNNSSVTIVPALFHSGPSLQLGFGRVALHTHSSVMAKAGSTTILCTVARAALEESGQLQTGESSFLTVEYRQRAAGVGQIPGNRLRSDQGRTMSSSEVLAARILDRSLRPLLKQDDEGDAAPAQYHVLAAVHAIDLWSPSRTGHAIATALNAASAALVDQLTEPVAGTVLAVMSDGSIVQDPGPDTRQPIQIQPLEPSETASGPIMLAPYCVGELFYSGTRTHAIMMEWTSIHDSLPEDQWPALLKLAAAAIQPILDTIEELHKLHKQRTEMTETVDVPDGFVNKDVALALNAQLRSSLGLPPLDTTDESSVEEDGDSSASQRPLPKDLLPAALSYCRKALGETPIHSLYGVRVIGIPIQKDTSLHSVAIHKNPKEILSKIHRGRRETIINQEIYRLVDQFITTEAGMTLSSSEEKDETSIVMPESERRWLQQKVGYYLLQHGLWETSWRFGTRSDGRRHVHMGQGWKTVRPVQILVPALPDSVHGSAIFARGDTQVLCTVTLGAPKEGQSILDPFLPLSNPQLLGSEATNDPSKKAGSDFDNLPVGSLRFLRTQEALESDLNSRKSLADKERTGDSGNLAEVKRAFLQYDFPAYSTGEVPKRGGMDRRSIGHGALAERAILPILPDAHIFPYAIRITSEVTDSNGSSSMASVCGATLALRDAGVPLKASVAGVSVGLAVCNEEVFDPESNSNDSNLSSDDKKFSLLLDITGTEDHVSG